MSLIGTIVSLAPDALHELELLLTPLLGARDPKDALAKARRNLEMNALDAATDAGVSAALKEMHKKLG